MKLTELEGAVLALIGEAPEGATAYNVKEVLRRSPTQVWSGSAGAVYPLLDRLEKRSLVRGRDEATGNRPRRLYTLTPSGHRAMLSWLGDPDRAADMGTDPLRMRMLFIDQIPKARRKAFFDAISECLDRNIAAPPSGGPLVEAMHEIWMRKRREGFAEVRQLLEKLP